MQSHQCTGKLCETFCEKFQIISITHQKSMAEWYVFTHNSALCTDDFNALFTLRRS